MDKSQYAAAAALGAYAMQRGNVAEAIRFWQEALALNPAMTLVRVNLAKALLRAGNPGEAERLGVDVELVLAVAAVARRISIASPSARSAETEAA